MDQQEYDIDKIEEVIRQKRRKSAKRCDSSSNVVPLPSSEQIVRTMSDWQQLKRRLTDPGTMLASSSRQKKVSGSGQKKIIDDGGAIREEINEVSDDDDSLQTDSDLGSSFDDA